MTAEQRRLEEDAARALNWKRWGTYLSERQWGTVREDYSADGDAWAYLPHDDARSRAYRWGEDGLLGWTDRECRLCFALALWNGRDPILKERLFGLTNPQGNHGEDVKEAYFYLDATPTHSYAKALYKYPQAEFPYARLVEENARRSREEREFELADTGVFDASEYFDVLIEYAKAGPDDILIRLTISNRAQQPATLHALPTLWFRNSWSWGCTYQESCWAKPAMRQESENVIAGSHATLGDFRFRFEQNAPLLFTENETNNERIFGAKNASPFVKDAFHKFVIGRRADAVNPLQTGTKAAAHYALEIAPQASVTLRMRLSVETPRDPGAGRTAQPEQPESSAFADFEGIFSARIAEADEFYAAKFAPGLSDAERQVARQAYAGLLWTKQYYHYVVKDWLAGDPLMPPPPPERLHGRNSDWPHLYNADVISMPDKWEYPWYAAWDLAFHTIPLSRIDPEFAKEQLVLFLREWYLNPNGAMPAYEWNFSDVNPPVHAWACWRAYKIAAPRKSAVIAGAGTEKSERDRFFLERTFQKLLLNFTWWVNRKDIRGRQVFSGGFLGLDNIGLFDRSKPLPGGGQLAQADGTAWMAFYCGTMLSMSLELALENPAYEDIASKFFEHFVEIVDAMNAIGGGAGLWNDEDGFYYDQLLVDGHSTPLRVRSLVGLVPLLAVEILDQETIERLPGFRKRLRWFIRNRADLAQHISYMEKKVGDESHVTRRLLAIPSRERLARVLRYVLDENEFLSPCGIRSVSRIYKDHPYVVNLLGSEHCIGYEPAESRTGLFGGNSNWRGPIWFPLNYLLVEALERYHHYYGDEFQVECPVGSGKMLTLQQAANELARRLAAIFLPDENGRRPCYGEGDSANAARFASDPHWRELVLFNEYFDGDNGRGLGASHQTGWTALVTRCMGIAAREAE